MAEQSISERVLEQILPEAWEKQIEDLRFQDAGYGYDAFGLNKEWMRWSLAILRPLYETWFRTSSRGAERIPSTGGAILASNHSGVLPFDGMILYMDVLRHTHPPRIVRPVVDYFVSHLPFVSTFFSRMGVVGGSRGNVEHLLRRGELLQLFPEGVPGIRKPFSERYKLRPFRVGHVEMAIRYGVPVIPVAVIGAEEQFLKLADLPLKMFGAPYLPVFFPLFPMPVHYHIYYGQPLDFSTRYKTEDADNPQILEQCAAEVQASVAALIARGLHERDGVFG